MGACGQSLFQCRDFMQGKEVKANRIVPRNAYKDDRFTFSLSLSFTGVSSDAGQGDLIGQTPSHNGGI